MSNRIPDMRQAFVVPGFPETEGLVELARRSARRRAGFWSRRPLRSPERLLMWLLRLYVLAMLGVVALQISRLA
jgi:hypothetical protein